MIEYRMYFPQTRTWSIWQPAPPMEFIPHIIALLTIQYQTLPIPSYIQLDFPDTSILQYRMR